MLYIVATPIGNLEDMTFRAIRTLKEVDYIFAEDTRVTKKLLDHYEIKSTVYRYDEHTKQHQVANIINLLKEEKNIALVTDAGTPCISDPGYEVVDEAIKRVRAGKGNMEDIGEALLNLKTITHSYQEYLTEKQLALQESPNG